MTITPSLLRVLTASFGYAVLFDFSLVLVLSIGTDVRKPEPLFYLAMFGIIYILCYVTIYLSCLKSVVVTQKLITLHHHFDQSTTICWRDINWADYKKRPCCLWRIFSLEGKRVVIPQGTLSHRDERRLSYYIVRALPEITLNQSAYSV